MKLTCKSCGSEKMIAGAHVLDQGQHSDRTLKAHVGYNDPGAIFLREAVYARLKANICGACGHAQIYAENPGELYEAYLKWQNHG
jgi:hypothetical protein